MSGEESGLEDADSVFMKKKRPERDEQDFEEIEEWSPPEQGVVERVVNAISPRSTIGFTARPFVSVSLGKHPTIAAGVRGAF